MQDVRPGADAIDLREIHLARQSSLQVPVGHIPVPGGIKLCSPGTFGVANYLIINNGSCQVNFMKIGGSTAWRSITQPISDRSLFGVITGLRHVDLAHRFFRAISAWRSSHLSALRHGDPTYRCPSGILAEPL